MPAAPRQFGRQRAAFGTKHIGRPQGMGKAREIVGALQDFDPDQAASFGQLEFLEASPMVDGQMRRGPRRVGPKLKDPVVGADGEHEARPKGMGRTQQIAEIDGLGDAFHANAEIAADSREQGFHDSCLPQAPPAKKDKMEAASAGFS